MMMTKGKAYLPRARNIQAGAKLINPTPAKFNQADQTNPPLIPSLLTKSELSKLPTKPPIVNIAVMKEYLAESISKHKGRVDGVG